MKNFIFKDVRFSVPESVGVEITYGKILFVTELLYIIVVVENGVNYIKIIEQPDGENEFVSLDVNGKICFNEVKLHWTNNSFVLKFYENLYSKVITM